MSLRYRFWMWLFNYVQKQKKAAYLTHHGMDSNCPCCKQWESDGVTISNSDLEDGSTIRGCSACGHKWKTVFTPFGFIPVDEANALRAALHD